MSYEETSCVGVDNHYVLSIWFLSSFIPWFVYALRNYLYLQGRVNYQGQLPYLHPAQLPFCFNINMGHILTRHGFNNDNFNVKSMFCLKCLHGLALWQLITYAFVAECSSPDSKGPIDTHLGLSLVRIVTTELYITDPHLALVGQSSGRVARWLYIRYMYNVYMVFICQAWPSSVRWHLKS